MAKKKKNIKTNAMRLLETAKVNFNIREYPEDGPIAATDVAKYLNQPTDRVFKTLVTTAGSNEYFVFCLPGDNELDLKAGAKIAGVKKIEMLKQKDLFPLTGYIHGGCSPIGMKKVFPTFIDNSAFNWESIYVSAGKIGMQIEIDPTDLKKLIDIEAADICKN